MEPMKALEIVRVQGGRDRQDTMADRRQALGRLRMKHISWHIEGYHIRISYNGKMHSAWKAFRHFENDFDCLKATIEKRNDMLKKMGKPLSPDPVPMGSVGFLNRRSNSNTGYRGIYYREYTYQKRGINHFTRVIDVRWWNKALGEFGHTTVACKKHGGRKKATQVAREIQKELEAGGGSRCTKKTDKKSLRQALSYIDVAKARRLLKSGRR